MATMAGDNQPPRHTVTSPIRALASKKGTVEGNAKTAQPTLTRGRKRRALLNEDDDDASFKVIEDVPKKRHLTGMAQV